jgi:hypothetical protein
MQAAARARTLKPNDYTNQNPSCASAAGGVISTANDLAIWIQALVGGKVFNADYQRQWLDSLQPEGQKYGYRIAQNYLGTEHDLFSRRRDARLQLKNQLRPNQQADAHPLDQSDYITRRPADRQYPLGESARSDLQSVTAVALFIAEKLSKAGWSWPALQRARADIKKPIEK